MILVFQNFGDKRDVRTAPEDYLFSYFVKYHHYQLKHEQINKEKIK